MSTTVEAQSRPIIFGSKMVNAILSGKKTQTRRIISRPQPGDHMTLRDVLPFGEGPNDRHAAARFVSERNGDVSSWGCPYGRPGDFLWVRETFDAFIDPGARKGEVVRKVWNADECETEYWCVDYKADGNHTRIADRLPKGHPMSRRWTPSIHMPRWASRITLRIVSIGVERLQDISIDDVIAEGIERVTDGPHANEYWREETGARFVSLWDEINGAKSNCDWKSNPWVWRVEFSCVSHQEDTNGHSNVS